MSPRIAFASALFLALAGACVHVPQSATRKYASAPRLENPLLAKAQAPTPGFSHVNEAILFTAFDGQRLCFEGQDTQSPMEATATQYSLAFLNTDEVNFKSAPTLKTSAVKVLSSQSQMVSETHTVQDTVRDSQGNKVATVDRQVQQLVPHYQTQFQVCFSGVLQALSTEARFMVLLREAGNRRATWGIPSGPRDSWVWRFPAGDLGPAPPAAPVAAK